MMKRTLAPVRPYALVTGAAGFLGSHVCDRLIERGHEVFAIDDLSTGDMAHVAHLQGHPLFHFARHDITLPLPAEAQRAQRIYNLACPAAPAYMHGHPVHTVLTSTLGLWRLLELAQSTGARLLHASAGEVYGDAEESPQLETYWGHVNPAGPRACHDEGKRAAETMCLAYAMERGVEVRIGRIFNSYGPRLRAASGHVVSNFIAQALSGTPLTVYGSGHQTRTFCYVDDTVEALMKLMSSDCDVPLNIGHSDEHSILGLAERVLALTGSRSRVEHRLLPGDDPMRRLPHIAAARRRLHWQPQVALDEGLKRTIAYFRTLQLEPAANVYVRSTRSARSEAAVAAH